MSNLLPWVARVSLCAAVTISSLGAAPAMAAGDRATLQISVAGQPPVTVDRKELGCLTEALYYEARGEGAAGQQAVAEVILNRVDHPRFPQTVCGVVNQRGQFSYQGRVTKNFREHRAYQRAQKIAAAALAGAPRSLTSGATYFHTVAVRPAWSRRFTRTVKIGSHVFYRNGSAQRLASN